MSEPHSEKDKPEALGDPEESVPSGSPDSEPAREESGSQVAPWTADVPRAPGPAPVIELDNPMDSGSVKPLGPRRLARLQREMAVHAREIQEAEQANGGEVDQDLLLKQQRFAELAMRAAAANEQVRKDAEAALRAAQTESVAGTETGSVEAAEQETITVSFPQSTPLGSALAADPLTEDPGHFPSSPVVPASGPHTVSINLVPAASGPSDRDLVVPANQVSDEQTEGTGDLAVAPPEEPAAAASSGQTSTLEAPPETQPAAEAEEPSTVTPVAPEPMPSEQVSAPGTPVRAVDAQGLELLDPNAYQQKSGALVPLIVLLVLVIAALVAVLVIFVL